MEKAMSIVFMVIVLALPCLAMAADYTVGDSQQWIIGPNYTSWASSKTFNVGDKLVFKYGPTLHDVVEVNKGSYDACTASNTIKKYTSGSDSITLDTTGTRYFICSIPGHCSAGMKFSVNVISSTSSPSPSSSTTPPPTASSDGGAEGPSESTTGEDSAASFVTCHYTILVSIVSLAFIGTSFL